MLNTQTRVLQTYGQHRQRTMELISLAAVEFGSLTEQTVSILGAGNCMDLDLQQLATIFHSVSLLDIDCDAVESGVNAAEGLQTSRVQIVAPVDLATPLATTTTASGCCCGWGGAAWTLATHAIQERSAPRAGLVIVDLR